MSLYDKYHSAHNKNYMYELIKNVIHKEYEVDITSIKSYNDFFEMNYKESFLKIDTEDIKDINKHLLDTQINFFQENILKRERKFKSNSESKLVPISDKDSKEDNESIHDVLLSLKRVINLENSSRFNYKLNENLKNKPVIIEKIIIPIEDCSLFIGPFIVLSINEHIIQLHLRGTIKVSSREYGIYSPYSEEEYAIKEDKIKISFMNQMFTKPSISCDVYKIKYYDKGQIMVDKSITKEFLVDDYIRICNFENIALEDESFLTNQYKVTEIKENQLLIECSDPIKEGLYIMNLSLQHTIHVSY